MQQSLVFLAGLLQIVSAAILTSRNASYACNNSPELCSRSYSNITYLGAHDSPFTSNTSGNDATFTDAGNQNVDSIAQLSAGVRLLTAQVHDNNGAWHLCHSSCSLLDAGTLSAWLASIKAWMDENPYDVVTILLVNSDNASSGDLNGEFEAANITSYGYVPPSTSAPLTTWPTLQDMIANNTRLVTFVTPLQETSGSEAPYLLPEFNFVFENNYNVTNLSGFSCTADRPESLRGQTTTAAQSGRLPLVNHFLYRTSGFGIQTPDTSNITTTNAASGVGSLGEAATSCTSAYGRRPAFLLVDYFDQGDTLSVVDNLNGVSATGRTPTSPSARPGANSAAAAGPMGGSWNYILVVTFFATASSTWISGSF